MCVCGKLGNGRPDSEDRTLEAPTIRSKFADTALARDANREATEPEQRPTWDLVRRASLVSSCRVAPTFVVTCIEITLGPVHGFKA